MDQNATDLVMRFVLNRNPVWAECALEIDPTDTLMKDFGQNTGYDNYADFFEVSSFDFGVSLKESDESTSTLGPASRHPATPHANGPGTGAYARWRSATGEEYKNIYYPLEFDEFNFERTIDAASPIFFQCCCKAVNFDSAVLVKRLSQGDIGTAKGQFSRPSVGFLRIDFDKVLITSISWDDGDVVKEKCAFICQKMKITYRQQKTDGTISSGSEFSAIWPNPKNDRSQNIRGGRGT